MKFDSRKYVIITFFILIGIIYSFKLFYMQVVDDTWKLEAQRMAEKRREITPPRAVVFDRNGKKIVENKTYYNLMFVEADIVDFDTAAFGKLIGFTKEEIKNRFKEIREGEGYYKNPHTGKTTPNYQRERAYSFLKELTDQEISEIAPHLYKFKGFYEEVSSMRSYPYASGANILGYMSEAYREDVEADPFYTNGSMIGRAGIERYYEKEFRGIKGIKYIISSARNNDIGSFENGIYDTTAVQAAPIHMGLDVELQAYGEKLLQNKKGCIVAIEPSSGEILAMVSAPSYDPNLLVGARKIKENYPALLKDPNKPLFPRPLASEYPPGSIFKLIQALIGMQEGVITEKTGFPCNKSLVGCHNHGAPSDVSKAVQYSCNPYFYQVTRKIIHQGKEKNHFADAESGLNTWAKYMHSFGLGYKMDVDVTGMRPGLIPDAHFYDYEFPSKKRPYGHHQWAFSTIRSISIGQGEVMLTPMQMANVAVIMANRGWFYTPHFVKSVGNNGPLEQFRKKNYTMVERAYFDPVIEGMRRVVNEAGGTARLARLEGITVCGKTGTVENFKHGKKMPDHSVFIAFAPMDNPKIAIAVFIENAGFGGTWSAPTASLMIEKYLTGKIKDKAKEKRILEAKLGDFEKLEEVE